MRQLVLAPVLMFGCATAPTSASDDGNGSIQLGKDVDVYVADSSILSSIDVKPNELSLPASAAVLDKLAPGVIFVGTSGGMSSTNPLGFIRRVESLSNDGGLLLITTTDADLTDLVENGDFDTADDTTSARLTAPVDYTLPKLDKSYSNLSLYSHTDMVDGVAVDETLNLVSARIQGTPRVDVGASIAAFQLKRFDAKISGELDIDAQLALSIHADGDINGSSGLAAITHKATVPLFDSGNIALPAVWIGPIPVQLSVEFTGVLDCNLTFDGQIDANLDVTSHNTVAIQAAYDNGTWAPPITASFNVVPQFTTTGTANATAHCGLTTTATLGLFAVGQAAMSVTPYLDASVAVAANDYTYTVTPGADAFLSGDLKILGVNLASGSQQILAWKSGSPLRGSGTF